MQDTWINHREAAALMHINEKYLRERVTDRKTKAWRWARYPELRRFQPGGPKTAIFLDRAEVEAWKRRIEEAAARTAAPAQAVVADGLRGNAALEQALRQLGGTRTARAIAAL